VTADPPPFDPRLLDDWARRTRVEILARLRARTADSSPARTIRYRPEDLAAFDVPARNETVRLPAALGGGTATVVRWRSDGDRLILTRPGMREPFEVTMADITNPIEPRRRKRWTLRRTR
jgi:hypothetical protein